MPSGRSKDYKTRKINRKRHWIEDIDYVDYKKYSHSEMFELLKKASRLASQRQARVLKKLEYNKETHEFENKSIPTPQSYRRTRDGGMGWADYDFTIRKDINKYKNPKNINLVRHKFNEIQMFLRNETSTLEGWKDVMDRALTKSIDAKIIQNNAEQYSKLYDVYNAIANQFTQATLERYSYYGKQGLDTITDMIVKQGFENYTASEIATFISNDIEAMTTHRFTDFNSFNNKLMQELEEYNKKIGGNLTLKEYKEGLMNGTIENENDYYFTSR